MSDLQSILDTISQNNFSWEDECAIQDALAAQRVKQVQTILAAERGLDYIEVALRLLQQFGPMELGDLRDRLTKYCEATDCPARLIDTMWMNVLDAGQNDERFCFEPFAGRVGTIAAADTPERPAPAPQPDADEADAMHALHVAAAQQGDTPASLMLGDGLARA